MFSLSSNLPATHSQPPSWFKLFTGQTKVRVEKWKLISSRAGILNLRLILSNPLNIMPWKFLYIQHFAFVVVGVWSFHLSVHSWGSSHEAKWSRKDLFAHSAKLSRDNLWDLDQSVQSSLCPALQPSLMFGINPQPIMEKQPSADSAAKLSQTFCQIVSECKVSKHWKCSRILIQSTQVPWTPQPPSFQRNFLLSWSS